MRNLTTLFYIPMLVLSISLMKSVYACQWEVELLDHFSKEVRHFRADKDPLKISLLKPEAGVEVTCYLQEQEEIKMGGAKGSSIRVQCIYPDRQIVESTAVAVTDPTTGIWSLEQPVTLSFFHQKQLRERLEKPRPMDKKIEGYRVYSLEIKCK